MKPMVAVQGLTSLQFAETLRCIRVIDAYFKCANDEQQKYILEYSDKYLP
jgi:hypothetical protein